MWFLAACRSPEGSASSAPRVVEARCEVDPANAVRGACTVVLDQADSAWVELTDGAETVRFTDSTALTEHRIPVWGLTPDAVWTWSAPGFDGTLTTGSVPDALDVELTVTAIGESALDMVFLPLSCHSE